MSPKQRKKTTSIDDLLEKGLLRKGSDERFVIHRIPFGMPDLDEVVGGGLPRNRITIMTGEYSAGKSFLVQLFMKNALDNGLQVAYIDTERTFDPVWWKQVGLDIDEVLVSQPPSGEAAIDVAAALAESGVDVIAVDSLAGLVPSELAEAEAAKQFIAIQAKLVTRLMQKFISIDHTSAIVCTNQLRSSIGPGPMDAMPGGWSQKFFTHMLLRIYREGWMMEKGEKVGFDMKIICRKSKVSRAYRECILPFRFRGVIDVLSLLIDRGLEAGIIEQRGPWYSIFGDKKSGRNALLELLGGDDALRQRLETALGEEETD